EDPVEPVELEVFVGEVEPDHVQRACVLLLQGGVVVVGEAIDSDDLVPAAQECLPEVRPDEAGGAGDEVPHSTPASGLSVPSPFAVRLRSEKKRVITIPSRKSPSRGSGRSPRASASASSG